MRAQGSPCGGGAGRPGECWATQAVSSCQGFWVLRAPCPLGICRRERGFSVFRKRPGSTSFSGRPPRGRGHTPVSPCTPHQAHPRSSETRPVRAPRVPTQLALATWGGGLPELCARSPDVPYGVFSVRPSVSDRRFVSGMMREGGFWGETACEPGSPPRCLRPQLSLSSGTGRGWHFICAPAWLGVWWGDPAGGVGRGKGGEPGRPEGQQWHSAPLYMIIGLEPFGEGPGGSE